MGSQNFDTSNLALSASFQSNDDLEALDSDGPDFSCRSLL